jgi:anti-sigma B factor antagonist
LLGGPVTGVPGQGFQVMAVDGVAVVIAPAEIDVANAGALRDAITSAGTSRAAIVVDMTATEFCDSSGLSVLVWAHKRARADGGELRLVMGSPAVYRVFKVTAVDRVLRIFTGLPEAVAASPPSTVPAL